MLATHERFGLNNSTSPQFDPWSTSTELAFFDGHLKGLPGARAYLTSANLQIVSAGKATISGR